METFTYTYKSQTVFYNGQVFDSLLELQYALMIEDTHAWLRDGLEIYYGINAIPNGIKGDLYCYRPDLLIRDWSTGEAQLIEIKPDGFNHDSLQKRRKIAERHIKRFTYDWSYRIVFESEIKLTSKQCLRYEKILATQHDWKHKPCIELLQNNSTYSDSDYQHFVFTGIVPALYP